MPVKRKTTSTISLPKRRLRCALTFPARTSNAGALAADGLYGQIRQEAKGRRIPAP